MFRELGKADPDSEEFRRRRDRIIERCLPLAAPKSQASTDFTACPTAGTCVLGQDADACTYVPRR